MLHQNGGGVYHRTPLRTYHPENAPSITACVTYSDPSLGIVARSIRSSLGIMRASTAIHFDAGVFEHLLDDGVEWLECHIKDTGITYYAHVATMRDHGRLQQRYGPQWVLSLKYWSTDGQGPTAATSQPNQSLAAVKAVYS